MPGHATDTTDARVPIADWSHYAGIEDRDETTPLTDITLSDEAGQLLKKIGDTADRAEFAVTDDGLHIALQNPANSMGATIHLEPEAFDEYGCVDWGHGSLGDRDLTAVSAVLDAADDIQTVSFRMYGDTISAEVLKGSVGVTLPTRGRVGSDTPPGADPTQFVDDLSVSATLAPYDQIYPAHEQSDTDSGVESIAELAVVRGRPTLSFGVRGGGHYVDLENVEVDGDARRVATSLDPDAVRDGLQLLGGISRNIDLAWGDDCPALAGVESEHMTATAAFAPRVEETAETLLRESATEPEVPV